jgi:hypothetical protein
MENNKTQSAVEWLKKELETYGSPQICIVNWEDLDLLIEQAKQMEEQRIQQELEKLKDFDDWKEWKTKNRF